MALSFEVTREDRKKIDRTVELGLELCKDYGVVYDRLDMAMDLTACHASGTPLDFDRLVEFDDGSFAHDLFGIRKYLDRQTGELTDNFLPRCAKLEA